MTEAHYTNHHVTDQAIPSGGCLFLRRSIFEVEAGNSVVMSITRYSPKETMNISVVG